MDLISQKEVYKKGSIVLTEKVFNSEGKDVVRVSLSLGKNSVLVIPIDDRGNFYLGQQKRGDSKESMLEFPNGGIEKDESEIQAAKRELSEELGLDGDFAYIGKFRPFFALVDLEVSVFVCRNANVQPEVEKLKPDFYENIERRKFTESEIYDLIKAGKVKTSYFLSALSLYKANNF